MERSCVSIKSLQSCLTLCDPMDCSLPGFSVHGILPGKNTGVGCHVLLQGMFLPQGSGIEPTSPAAPALWTDSLPTELQAKPHISVSTLFSCMPVWK